MGPEGATLVPTGRVLIPVALAATFEPAAWLWFTAKGVTGSGWYGAPDLLVGVHLLTVGTLALSLLGASWQLAAVATTRPWPSWVPAPWLNAAVILALPGFYIGLAHPGSGLGVATLSALLLITALALRALLFLGQLARGARPIVRAWLIAAELCLLGGLAVAFVLWGARSGVWPGGDAYRLVHHHAALLLGGWVGGWIIGIGSLLLPMFTLGKEPEPKALALAGLLYFSGIALTNAPLWAAGAGAALVLLAWSLARGVHRGPSMVQAAVGLFGLGAASLLLVFVPVDNALAVGLVLGLLPLLRGVSQRVVPFFLWTALLSHDPGRAPPAASLLPARFVGWAAAASLLGGLVVVVGRAGYPAWGRAGALLALLGALGHLGLLATALTRARAARARLAVIPGMELR